MTWYVASLRDHDTHLAQDDTDGGVTALCGQSFRPLARLAGQPHDPSRYARSARRSGPSQ